MSAPGSATCPANVTLTSAVGSGLMTSAVGPVEVIVDRSMLTSQWSNLTGGSCCSRAKLPGVDWAVSDHGP